MIIVACRPQLVKGYMQLYSVEQKRSQALEAHAAAFSTLKVGLSALCCARAPADRREIKCRAACSLCRTLTHRAAHQIRHSIAHGSSCNH